MYDVNRISPKANAADILNLNVDIHLAATVMLIPPSNGMCRRCPRHDAPHCGWWELRVLFNQSLPTRSEVRIIKDSFAHGCLPLIQLHDQSWYGFRGNSVL